MSLLYKPNITIDTHNFDRPRASLVQAPSPTSLPLKILENRTFQAISGALDKEKNLIFLFFQF